MFAKTKNKVFSSLKISEDQLLDEVALLLARQQLSEFNMEVEYYEKKYQQTFDEFDQLFRSQKGSFELENDWLSWKFASESKNYWQNLISGNPNDS